jgi:16S rRNA (guanine966-N2)-methyltransferase
MKNNLLRIIGGEWRSRRLKFADVPGLRPTPDRVRETLFNWLQMTIPGARCLDLFAGSGALGLEALSRGASEVVLVEKHPAAVQALRDNLTLLNTSHAQLIHDDALRFLQRDNGTFDVIFLDPPFRKNLLEPVLTQLISQHYLKSDSFIYLERENEDKLDFAHFNLEIYRQTSAGQVQSFLLKMM